MLFLVSKIRIHLEAPGLTKVLPHGFVQDERKHIQLGAKMFSKINSGLNFQILDLWYVACCLSCVYVDKHHHLTPTTYTPFFKKFISTNSTIFGKWGNTYYTYQMREHLHCTIYLNDWEEPLSTSHSKITTLHIRKNHTLIFAAKNHLQKSQ